MKGRSVESVESVVSYSHQFFYFYESWNLAQDGKPLIPLIPPISSPLQGRAKKGKAVQPIAETTDTVTVLPAAYTTYAQLTILSGQLGDVANAADRLTLYAIGHRLRQMAAELDDLASAVGRVALAERE